MPKYERQGRLILKDGWPLLKITKYGKTDFPKVEEHTFEAEFSAIMAALNNQTPDHPNDTVDVLIQAESFISGFEGDEMQEGIVDLLAGLRTAIVREQAQPDLLSFVKRHAERNPVFAKGHEKEIIAEARRLVAQAEGR